MASTSIGLDSHAAAIDVEVTTPAAHLLTGRIPSYSNDSATATYESAGLSGQGDGPILELATTNGDVLYQLNINFPGGGQLTGPSPSLSFKDLPAYSTGNQVTVQVPLSDVRGIGRSFLWQFVYANGNTEQVCPANDDQKSYIDMDSAAQAADPQGSLGLSTVVVSDFGRYPAENSASSSSTPSAMTTLPPATASTTTIPPDTTPATTTPSCTGQLVVKVSGSTQSDGNAALQGTVTNTTNVSVDLYAIVLNETYPASSASWNAQGAQADVNNQYGTIAPGATETWSIYEPIQDGTPITPTVDVAGFVPQANTDALPLNQACSAEGTGSSG